MARFRKGLIINGKGKKAGGCRLQIGTFKTSKSKKITSLHLHSKYKNKY